MSDHPEDKSPDDAPRAYEPPRLTHFGSIQALTAGGSLMMQNEFRFVMGNMVVDTCDDITFMAPGVMC